MQDLEVMYGIAFVSGRFVRYRSSLEYRPAIFYYSAGTVGLLWVADSWTTTAPITHVNAFSTGVIFNDDTRGVIYFYNLEAGGVHEIAVYTVTNNSIGFASSRYHFIYARSNTTVYRWPGSSIASTGSMISSLYDGDSGLTKRFRGVVVDYDEGTDGDGGSVDIAYRINDVDSTYTNLVTGAVAGTEYAINQTARSVSIRVTLNKGTSTMGPKVKRTKVRASPLLDTFRRTQLVIELAGRNQDQHMQLRSGQLNPKDGHEAAVDLLTIAQTQTPVTIIDRFGTYTGIIENDRFEVMEIRPEEYVAVVPLREV